LDGIGIVVLRGGVSKRERGGGEEGEEEKRIESGELVRRRSTLSFRKRIWISN